ncbi:selenocysteine-specific translation elongation factor [Acidimicrobiia bacterium EGI L10123]|uniref:selenocysteine-specific translation elongation factor n=1 Tax=Salinilacustrithrix flava TaxID=2957203 RepID=UPI003D7C2C7B|nr:selenocysteine-specific translation elongation factor [Acidimicrobiia bacterium EGI L10123]
MHVVATAGHVDHGKSTLVLHLTGTDPDRLAEEKARGLTIDLGFAGATLPSGRRMAMIDVPGHVRFLKNMLAGMGAVDACLFVVAASEGWKPQSEEHLRILDVLGVRHGLIALTKVGLVDDDLHELARLEVEEAVAGTFLEGAPVVGVDAPTGRGLDDLRTALDELLAVTPTAVDHGRPRLWIDRSFAPPGAGTVVTGTLAGGSVAVDDELLLAPAGTTVRVRAIQRLHEQVQQLEPGNRTALNLVGVSHGSVDRGDVLVRDGQWHHTDQLDASLTVLGRLDHAVSRRGAYLAYIGSGEHPVQLRVLGPQPIEPGETGMVRLHLARHLPLLPGDRYVLRDAGRGETVGGGEVLDVDPVLRASRAAPDRRVERVVAERGWVDAHQLALLTGERVEPTIGRWVVSPVAWTDAVERVTGRLLEAGPLGLDLATLDERDRAVAERLDDVVVEQGRIVAIDAIDPLDGHPWLGALAADPFAPPAPPDDLGRNEIRELVRRGAVVEVDGIAFGAGAIEQTCDVVRGLLEEHPEGVTVAQIRDRLGTSRKYVLPLLAHLDGTGRTRRRGDLRIAGPRLVAAEG